MVMVPENAKRPVMLLNLLRRVAAGTGQNLDREYANILSVKMIAFMYLKMFLGIVQGTKKT